MTVETDIVVQVFSILPPQPRTLWHLYTPYFHLVQVLTSRSLPARNCTAARVIQFPDIGDPRGAQGNGAC